MISTQNLEFKIDVLSQSVLGTADAQELIRKLRETADKVEAASEHGYSLSNNVVVRIKLSKEVEVDIFDKPLSTAA